MSKKVILDVDPGIDDAIAILMALKSPELEVLGITTVAGNIDVERGTKNALSILDILGGLEIPVFKGHPRPLMKDINITNESHGKDGLANIYLPISKKKEGSIPADDFIIETIERNPNLVTIISLAPMTNIAYAIKKSPNVMKDTVKIISMGGGVKTGNMSPVSEFNYWTDPDAAAIVYNFCIPITMVGLNVTTKVVITPNDFKLIEKMNSAISKFINSIKDFYMNYYWEYENIMGCVLHDPMAVAVACEPELIQYNCCNVQISTDGITRGECVADLVDMWKKRKNCKVALQVNNKRFRDRLYSTLFPEFMDLYRKYNKFLQLYQKN